MTFKYRYRKQIIIISLVIITLLITTIPIVNIYSKKETKSNSKKTIVLAKKEKNESKQEVQDLLKVDIKGEIINPGIYSMPISSRVIDVIEKAGGLTVNANTTVINLSKKISDEMVIIIYSNEQVNNFKKTKEQEQEIQAQCVKPSEESIKNDACISTETITTEKISINSASLEQLQTLSGIGESKAKDIINYRETNGLFKSIEDIKNVPGIGEALFAKIKENITL